MILYDTGEGDLDKIFLSEYRFLFSLVPTSSLSPRFGPKWNSKMPVDHPPPTYHIPPTLNF